MVVPASSQVLGWTILLAPLCAAVLILLFGIPRKRLSASLAILGLLTSFLCVGRLFLTALADPSALPCEWSISWIALPGFTIPFGILIDQLSLLMTLVVTGVGSAIFIYSIGYMAEDQAYSRFFGVLSLFAFSMLTIVLSNNWIQLFIGWELVGCCSYLLIGHWYAKPSAAEAGKKAFMVNRVADVGFMLGILALWAMSNPLPAERTFHFETLKNRLMELAAAGQLPMTVLPLIGLLIFCGPIGKSAQFPLHVWLPDAMEGPTPVSALIHSATMVAGGVYLVARTFGLITAFPDSLTVIATIGTITAFMAAFFGLTQTDIKRVLAYSTISQLGFMIAALGLKGYTAGTFHLMTHAFFKALLFLGAGSVIHGTGTQDIREMGGLWKKMPHTTLTFLIGSLALAGVPPLAGFWSKDEILAAAWGSENKIFYYALTAAAAMTAFYMFRLVFLTFFGRPRKEIRAHESPAVMTVPLWILAAGSAAMGLPGSPWMNHAFQRFIEPHAHTVHAMDPWVMNVSIGAGLGGILLAAVIYLAFPKLAEIFGTLLKPLYLASNRKLWFDELYQATVIRAWYGFGRALSRFDQGVIDRAVNGSGIGTLRLSDIQNWIDTHLVDGTVNAVGALTRAFSGALRKIQTGLVQNYLFVLFLGLLVILFLEQR